MIKKERLVLIFVISALFVLVATVAIPFFDGNRLRNETSVKAIQELEEKPGELVKVEPISGMIPLDESQFVVTSADSILRISNATDLALKLSVSLSVINTVCGQSVSLTGFWKASKLLSLHLGTGDIEASTVFSVDVEAQGFNLVPIRFNNYPCTTSNENGLIYGELRVDDVAISTKTNGTSE